MRLTVLEEIPEDLELRDAWNALALKVDRPQVFYTFEWSMAAQRAYRTTLHPLVFLAFDSAGSLCGVAPLAIDEHGTQASFLCATTADYCDLLSLPDNKSDFVAAVMRELRQRAICNVTLTNLPAESTTVTALREASALHGYHIFARTAYICAQVTLCKLGRRAGDNKLALPGKKNLRRALAAMSRQGPVRLDHARTWDGAGPLLPEFVLAHVARFLATGRVSNLAQPERQRFLEQLAILLSQSGWLLLTRLMAGDTALAWNYGFQFQDTWFWYQPTFDNDWERHSPGFCLLTKVIEEAADSDEVRVVDLGLGAEEYKDRFANSSRETLYVTLRSSAARHFKEILRYRASGIVKSFPALEAGIRKVLESRLEFRKLLRRKGVTSTIGRALRVAAASVWSKNKFLLFEWTGPSLTESGGERLSVLNWRLLAAATLQNVNDATSVAYLLRSAARLREKKFEGFVLTDPNGLLRNFAWAADFEVAALNQLNAKISAPSSDCVLLFDWYSPTATGDGATLARLMASVAERLSSSGKKTWAFAAADDIALIQCLTDAGFQRRYSAMRRRILGRAWVDLETPDKEAPESAGVASGV